LVPWFGSTLSDWHQGVPLVLAIALGSGFAWALLRPSAFASHPLTLWAAIVVWCAVVVLVTGGYGPSRVWSFALPLYLGTAAAGCAALLVRSRRLGAVPAVACAVVALAGFAIGLRDPGHYYREFGSMPEAEGIVQELAGRLREGDGLMTSFPANRPVAYYAERRGILSQVADARDRTSSDVDSPVPSTIYVVLNSPEQTVADVFEYNNRLAGSERMRLADYTLEDSIQIGDARLAIMRSASEQGGKVDR
jgi:hypothetical protein